jgi:hypothetical protein
VLTDCDTITPHQTVFGPHFKGREKNLCPGLRCRSLVLAWGELAPALRATFRLLAVASSCTTALRRRQDRSPHGARQARGRQREAVAAAVVITCLMDDDSVLDNLRGDDGIAGMHPGTIPIGASTISPKASTQLAELHSAQGSHYEKEPQTGSCQRDVQGASPSSGDASISGQNPHPEF